MAKSSKDSGESKIRIEENDLSEYEQQRLANIQRNQSFLASLGLGGTLSRLQPKKEDKKEDIQHIKAVQQVKKRAAEESKQTLISQPTRYSKRIRNERDYEDNVFTQEEQQDDEDDDGTIHYELMPMESNELDDHEFQVFIVLRKWRLMKSRELEVESYKIFQNRTLAEVIRRRRQDEKWAKRINLVDNAATSSERSPEAEEGNITIVSRDLLQCWGIGPSKSKPGSWTFEMLDVLDGQECADLLGKSRNGAINGDASAKEDAKLES